MKRTRRKPGPADEKEVRQYQTARGLLVDGIVGHQTFGQLKADIDYYKDLAERWKRAAPEPRSWGWGEMVIGAVIAVVLMALVQSI